MSRLKWTVAAGALAVGLGYSSFALAQADDAAERNPGDIVVTARRSEERLQDVPISITVFSQEQLSNRNIVLATDLAAFTPSLSINQRYGPEKSSFSIRGFVQEPNSQPSVGVYFADVVAPRAFGGTTAGDNAPIGSYMDLQNVQVLKGPQGTLFGRNTTGGAILLVPKKPTGDLEGYVEGSGGNFGMWRAQGVLNLPLADTFKVRVAVDRNRREGYVRNHSGIGPDDYSDINYFAARLSILAELTPDLENYTIATYSNSFGHGPAGRIEICKSTGLTGGQIFTGLPACDQIARQTARGDGPLDVEINNPDPFIKLRTWQVINTTTWQASENLTVKNIASYSELRERDSISLSSDNFTSRFPAGLPLTNGIKFQYLLLNPTANGENAAQSTFSEELQFQGQTSDGKLKWQAGGYIELSDPLGFSEAYTGILLSCTSPRDLACANPFGSGSISSPATKFQFTNKGVYAQGTYNLTDRLSVTGGIRYTWDKVRALGQSTRLAPQANGSFVRTCNDTVRFRTPTGAGLVVSDAAQCLVDISQSSSRPTWLIDVDYKPGQDVLIYAKYARGYRAGGLSLTQIGLESWQPEKVDSYEVGAKISYSGTVRGFFNAAAFYNDFSNQQIVVTAISNTAGFSGTNPIINAGKSRIQGVEIDASATLFDALRLDLGYTYLDTKLKSIVLPAVPVGGPYSEYRPTAIVGGQLALSPKNRVTLSATYTLPLAASLGEIAVGATFVHTDRQLYTQATLPEFQFLPKTDILNLNVNWNKALGTPVDLAFFMTNVTNQKYRVAVLGSYNSAGYDGAIYAPPRMWGLRARYTFGQ